MTSRVNHQEIVKRLLDSKAVDFSAIGKAFAELGPALAVSDEPWEGFCGTMRIFLHLFILTPGTRGVSVEDLGSLRSAAGELKG